MKISDILTPHRTLYKASLASQKKVFEVIAETFAFDMPDCEAVDIFEKLVGRERLGSSAIGKGIAIPHIRLLQAKEPMGCFILLHHPVDFGTGHLVDLVFSLIVPLQATTIHLELLAMIAHLFSQPSFCDNLRIASSRQELYERLMNG